MGGIQLSKPNASRIRRYATALAVLGALLGSCSTKERLAESDIRPIAFGSGPVFERVGGLRQALERSGDVPLRVLVVHGMRTNTSGYSENLQRRLARRLGLAPSMQTPPVEIDRGYDFQLFAGPQPYHDISVPSSQILKTTWVDPANPDVRRLVFYEMLWAPIRDQVKNRFLACFESRSVDLEKDCPPPPAAKPNTDARALLNGLLKDQLLVGGFADAMIVLSPVGDVLRDDISLAMCIIAYDELSAAGLISKAPSSGRCDLTTVVYDAQAAALTLERAEFIILTHSLGSFLVIDAQQQFAQARAVNDEERLRETLAFYLMDDSTVFMMANQISLIQLGRLSAACVPRTDDRLCPNRLLRSVDEEWAAPMPLSHMTTYVAFNDANDLLGFELPPHLPDVGLIGPTINVSVKNPGFMVPFLFKNPGATHTGHDDNPAVVEAIAEGFNVPE